MAKQSRISFAGFVSLSIDGTVPTLNHYDQGVLAGLGDEVSVSIHDNRLVSHAAVPFATYGVKVSPNFPAFSLVRMSLSECLKTLKLSKAEHITEFGGRPFWLISEID